MKHKDRNLAFTDTETTGLLYKTHEIISLALIVRSPQKEVLHRKVWYMHPRWPSTAHPKALEINGYNHALWEEKGVVSHETAFNEYAELTKGCLFVAHNPFLDKIMILEEYDRQGLKWGMDYHSLDTASLSWFIHTKGYSEGINLASVCEYFKIDNEGAHDALIDVERMIIAYDKIMDIESRIPSQNPLL